MQAIFSKQNKKKIRQLQLISVRRLGGNNAKAILKAANQTFQCAIGRSGTTALKREGDHATPIATMRVLSGLYKTDARRPLGRMIEFKPIKINDGWCDKAGDPNYNRPVKLPYRNSAETLLRTDHLYDRVIILDWNMKPRKRNCGSAIFLHVARPNYQPTQGCIALVKKDLERLIPYLSRKTRVIVVN